ncbi:PLP-dependent cysteine synthase family protein [Chryseosolibacter indicus]|uniref:Cysteine synthase family protein n=1 Tax=Chryseosolibacter indicus TaxID=2782351 RepID=A0ABS5W1D7_9BACT|nr:cysteine synthase family protein [Chryseosolibacter indicus]MBT1706081.1 cysteine synthase family protein [Chryseosolibacter indicus]
MNAMVETKTDEKLQSKFRNLWNLVGNTPMVEIFYTYEGKQGSVFAKCEHYNLTGSIKDRMALHILQKAYTSALIKPNDIIVEATSGNTGISFSALGKALGHRVRIIMPDWLSKERTDIIRSLGADIITISKEQGGFRGSIQLSEDMAFSEPNIFLPRQFANGSNVDAHVFSTGREIWAQLEQEQRIPDAFVAGVGTGGTVMGVGRFLKSRNPQIRIHPLEPAESPTLTTGHKVGSHRIQGISDEFIPSIVKLDELDEVIQANDGDAILISQKLAMELGLGVGISSGANIIGAIKLQQMLGAGSVVVTVLSDSNKKYLSTDLIRKEPLRQEYISSSIEFTGYRSLARMSGNTCL